MAAPLEGLRIVEFAGLGPGPFAAMMLADHGAEIVSIERPGAPLVSNAVLARGRRSIALNLKSAEGLAEARALCASADGLIEGYRPGVMEKLGLGPEPLLRDNPRLVYGRMTGWGQTGPLAARAGHDINYIGLTGALHAIGEQGGKPVPPLNLLGDFGAGGMMLAFGMVSAILRARQTGSGGTIDCAISDCTALLMAMIWGERTAGKWRDARGANWLDGGAPFYDSYRCADGRYVALGAIEPQFYAAFRDLAGLPPQDDAERWDEARWPALRAELTALFATRDRDDWTTLFEGSDACVTPVLTMAEAVTHPHNRARGTFLPDGDGWQPAPAPLFGEPAA